MRLNDILSSAESFLENLGYLRFSLFYSTEKSFQGEIVQKVARVVVGLFVILSVYDFISHVLPFKIKILVHGTLCFLISCLCLSVLLKGLQKVFSQPQEIPPGNILEEESSSSNVLLEPSVEGKDQTSSEEITEEGSSSGNMPEEESSFSEVLPQHSVERPSYMTPYSPSYSHVKRNPKIEPRNLLPDFNKIAKEEGLEVDGHDGQNGHELASEVL